ncbi:sunset domain-containing protein [Pontibacillus litoralis]
MLSKIATYSLCFFSGVLATLWYISSRKQNRYTIRIPVQEAEIISKCEEEAPHSLIKGNKNAKGERIYHIPGGQFYERVTAVETFQTEEEAQANGYRRSKR